MSPLHALLLTLAVASALLVIGFAAGGPTPAFDVIGMRIADAWRGMLLDSLFVAFTWLGSLAILLPLTFAYALRVAARVGTRAACFAPAALLGTALLTYAVKMLVDRPRPDLFAPLIAMPADASFPSAHSAQAAAVALALLLQPGRNARLPVLLIGLLVSAVVAVALSRIYLQVHFPSDVIAGLLLATGIVIALRALPFWRRKP